MNKNFIYLYYQNRKIIKIEIESLFKLNLDKIFKKLIGKKFKLHPLYHYYKKYDYFISSKPFRLKTKKKVKKKQNLICFATRNKPHIAHKKIIKYFSEKYNNIIISITQKNKIKNYPIIKKSYENFLKNENLKSKVKIYNFEFPSFSLGPREAMLQSLTRKNVYNGDFIVGRDHSGYKNFFKENDSFNLCKKYEKQLGFKILYSESPFYCKKCKKINFRFECLHWQNKDFFVDISSTKLKKINKFLKNG